MSHYKNIFFVVLIGCAGCASSAHRPALSDRQAQAEESAIAEALQQMGSHKVDYEISAADLLEVSVYQDKDMSRIIRVSQNGTITFPLIGSVQIGGLSVVEAQNLIASQLKDYIVNPQVTIFIREYGYKKVFVLGQVAKPGSYDLPTESKLTVLEAVSLAGGFTPIAAPNRTKVIRNAGGKSESFTIEVSAITKRGEKSKDMPLEASDVVYVPQSFF